MTALLRRASRLAGNGRRGCGGLIGRRAIAIRLDRIARRIRRSLIGRRYRLGNRRGRRRDGRFRSVGVSLGTPRRALPALWTRWPFLLMRLCGPVFRFIGRIAAGRFIGRLIRRSVPGGTFRRLLRSRWLLRRGVYCWCVFVIACQISLTPRPVMAENGSGSACWPMAFNPRRCSAWFSLSILDATTM